MHFFTTVILASALAICAPAVRADGLETFDNETAPSGTYADGVFTGNNSVVWTYTQARDATPDSGAYAINGAGIMLRRASSNSKLVSSTVGGGMDSFSVKLRKAFTGAGARQVALYINSNLTGTSEAFDDTTIRTFSVSNISVSGNFVIEVRALTEFQIMLDDLAWTSFASTDDPDIQPGGSINFGTIAPGSVVTQRLTIVNAGTSQTLVVSGFLPQSGATNFFTVQTLLPLNIAPNQSTGFLNVAYTPGLVTGAVHSATFAITSNDPSDPSKPVNLTGSTTAPFLSVSNIQFITGATSNSPYLAQTVTVQGVCTYVDARGYAIADPGGGPWSGVYISDTDRGPEPGDLLRIRGQVGELQSMTVISNISSYTLISTNQLRPAPVIVTAASARQEMYEGVVVCISNVTVSSERVSNTFWRVSDGSATCDVLHDSNRRLYRYVPLNGNTLSSISGIMLQNGATYQLHVRDDDDFAGRPVVHYALQGTVITPDGPRTNWFVEIRDDDIVYAGSIAPTVTAHQTGGLIFPGLIDTHNHQGWNSFPTLQFNNGPFGNRDAWANEAEYSDWSGRRTTVRNHPDVADASKYTIGKYGELLEMMSGCIAIQGMAYHIEFGHPSIGIMNIEAFPARIATDIFPWLSTATERATWLRRIQGGGLDALLIHLCEGTNEIARSQFDTWYNWGMLNKATTIIHGVPFGTNELDKIAAAGASIVWSPKSNMKLYHGTANIPLYKSRGVNIALAPDWTASGSYNMMEEMGYAWQLNQSIFSNALTARDVVDMTTINAARACALEHRYGKIAAGYNAGLVVIQDPGGDPYEALIHARPRSVLLTIVDGTPRFGDAAFMQSMGFTGETINAWGTTKTFNLVRNHPFLTYDTESVSNMMAQLATAHATLTPIGELDNEELQFLDFDLLQSGPDDVVPFVANNPLSAPTAGRIFTNDHSFTLAYRSQDFWDNDTDHYHLIHKQIALVPASNPTQVLQVVAENVTNNPANQSINVTLNYRGLHTNYYFRFLTADRAGSVRTALVSAVGFTVRPAPYDQDNDDLMDAWETQIVQFNGTDGYASIFDVQPAGDFDADGFTEEQEQFTGTIPVDGASYFLVQRAVIAPAGDRVILTWPSASNRTYTLIGMTNLNSGARVSLASGIASTPPQNVYTTAAMPAVQLFYLIRAE